jgi:hypothetical protein
MGPTENKASNNSSLSWESVHQDTAQPTIGGYKDRLTDSPLMWYGPHRKWCTQQFFYCCICCHGNLFLEPLPSNGKGKGDTNKPHRLMEEIYEAFCRDQFRCHDIHTKFHKDWFRHSKLDRGRPHARTHIHTETARWYHKSTFIFSK